jgi:hypothetical protein
VLLVRQSGLASPGVLSIVALGLGAYWLVFTQIVQDKHA